MKLLKIQSMVYCLWSTAAIINTEGIKKKKKRVLKYFNFFFQKTRGVEEREKERERLWKLFLFWQSFYCLLNLVPGLCPLLIPLSSRIYYGELMS